MIRASGVPFGLIFTLTQHNAASLDFVVRLAAEHGARSVQVHPLTLHGRAATDMYTRVPTIWSWPRRSRKRTNWVECTCSRAR